MYSAELDGGTVYRDAPRGGVAEVLSWSSKKVDRLEMIAEEVAGMLGPLLRLLPVLDEQPHDGLKPRAAQEDRLQRRGVA